MDVVRQYHELISEKNTTSHSFSLFKYTELLYIGVDEKGNAVVICESNKPNRSPIKQKTKKLSIETNIHVVADISGKQKRMVAHIIRCYCDLEKEIDIFLELCALFEEPSVQPNQEEALLETVNILASFFANTVEPSEKELQGLYAELYTMFAYRTVVNLGKYWQSRERMTFDFSLTDDVKVEVKSTVKNERKHHFRHEQLMEDPYTVYVISYMLRHDDEGLSLYDVIELVKPLLVNQPKKMLQIQKIIKNTSTERLKNFKFNKELMDQKKRVYRASDIPKFDEPAPEGVTNTEYDCNLTGAKPLDDNIFEGIIKEIEEGKS